MNKMGVGAFIITLMLIATPSLAMVDGWTHHSCINDTHLLLYEDNYVSTGHYTSNTTKICDYGCDTRVDNCIQPYNISPIQAGISLPLFVILSLVAFGLLVWGATKKHIIGCLFATILFPVLALQGIAFDSILAYTQFAGITTIIVGIYWIGFIASFLLTLLGAVGYLKDNKKDKQAMY